jgi:hypothetical protein
MPGSPVRGPTPAGAVPPGAVPPPARSADPPLDPHADRFAAVLTGLVMLAVLATSSEVLFAAQAVVFAAGAFLGPRYAPYPALYRMLRAHRLADRFARPTPTPTRSPRGEYAVGFALSGLGSLGYLTGLAGLGAVAAVLVLAAPVLGAATGAAFGVRPGGLLDHAFTRLHQPSHPDTQQGAIA